MKRFLSVLALGLAFVTPTWAANRELPKDMEVGYLKSVQYPKVVVTSGGFSWLKWLTLGLADDSQTLQMTRATKIRNQNHAFIVSGKLQFFSDNFVAFKRNRQNNIVQEIWILDEAEVAEFRKRAEENQAIREQLKQQAQ
ncbi:MAG: hypothetical protein II131_05395 [Neisseriaceae bacterium]|nr:hypothetical protein [Neisseriaceae bacterium]